MTDDDLLLGRPTRRSDGRPATLSHWRAAAARDPLAAARDTDGDFAVALTLPDGSRLLAVDRFAIRSLCWRVVGGRLFAAARADDLARIEPAAAIDPQAIYDYLYFHAIPSPRTVFAGVQRLPPGHLLRFANGRAEVEPYWVPTFAPAERPDFGALRDEFRELLRAAVRTQLDGAGRPACFLSGGTDSSTVAGVIGEVAGVPAATYSIGFEAEGYDEMAFARIAAEHFGSTHHAYYVTPADLVASIPTVAAHYDQPFGNSSALPAYCCAVRARDDGVSRLLAGDGGDELFGGNTRYAKQRVFDLYGLLPGAVRSGLLEPLLEGTPLGRAPLLKKGASYVGQAKVPMPDRGGIYNLLLRLQPDAVLTPGFLARIDRDDPARQQRAVWSQARAASATDRTLAYDWRYTLAEADLPKVVGTTQLAGVEVGFPLLDRRLVDFSMRLPADYKLRGLKLRWFFKEALRGFLPDATLGKKKQGFGLPFGVWAVRNAELKRLAERSLAVVVERGIVRADFAQRLVAEHLPAHPGYYGEMVWILMMLGQWLERRAPGVRVG